MTERCKSCDCILQRGDGELHCNFCEIEVVGESNTDPLYFTPGEFFKGLRLLFNEMDFRMFKKQLFPEPYHIDEYVYGYFERFKASPFRLWCDLDNDRQEKLQFLVYECARKEAQREGVIA